VRQEPKGKEKSTSSKTVVENKRGREGGPAKKKKETGYGGGEVKSFLKEKLSGTGDITRYTILATGRGAEGGIGRVGRKIGGHGAKQRMLVSRNVNLIAKHARRARSDKGRRQGGQQ